MIKLSIEVASPPPTEAKMEMWTANRAEFVWLIDPERRSVAIYRRGSTPGILHDPTSVHRTRPDRRLRSIDG